MSLSNSLHRYTPCHPHTIGSLLPAWHCRTSRRWAGSMSLDSGTRASAYPWGLGHWGFQAPQQPHAWASSEHMDTRTSQVTEYSPSVRPISAAVNQNLDLSSGQRGDCTSLCVHRPRGVTHCPGHTCVPLTSVSKPTRQHSLASGPFLQHHYALTLTLGPSFPTAFSPGWGLPLRSRDRW